MLDYQKVFREETINMACYHINMSPQSSLDGEVEDEVCTCNPIDLDSLSISRCPSYMHISSENQSKLDPKSKKRVFSGYVKREKGFKFWDLIKKKMAINKDVILGEQLMLKQTIATNVSAS